MVALRGNLFLPLESMQVCDSIIKNTPAPTPGKFYDINLSYLIYSRCLTLRKVEGFMPQ